VARKLDEAQDTVLIAWQKRRAILSDATMVLNLIKGTTGSAMAEYECQVAKLALYRFIERMNRLHKE